MMSTKTSRVLVTLVAGAALALGTATAAEAAPAGTTPAPATAGVPPVDCGPIATPTGTRDVIAESTPAGRPGCTAAITVMTEYFQLAPTQAEGTARVLTVRGWRCMTDTGAQGSGRTACDQAGQVFHT
jgi:hypothetical protein